MPTSSVLILQHNAEDGPAFLSTWLAACGVGIDLRHALAGQPLPETTAGYAALAILGGSMSVNDPLPSLRHEETLLLDAMARGLPVIGHCLGGQMMARALGAPVAPAELPEIGWHAVDWLPGAGDWFGTPGDAPVFQWHTDAFALPPGAQRLAGSAACPNQAFALGPHLAMQFHVELDADKLHLWCDQPDAAYWQALPRHPAQVQSVVAMLADAPRRLAAQQALAAAAYTRWLSAA